MFRLRVFNRIRCAVSGIVLSSLVLQVAGVLLTQVFLLYPLLVEAAETVIDATTSTTAGSNNVTGSQTVFISDTDGYAFYRDSTGQCVYSKTTDAGNNWNTPVLVDSQTDCLKIVVWYDRWTPGDTTGDNIHIATLDNSLDDIFYNRLDTSDDSLLLGSSPVNTAINSAQTPTISVNVNTHTITKATDGEIYVATNDVSDSYVVSCNGSCDLTTSWNEVGSTPLDAQNDHNLLMPLAGGNVMIINRDISANDLRSKIWNGSVWSSWSNIDNNAPESGRYDGGLAATLDVDTNNIYLVYAADHNNNTTADHDLRTAVYDGSGWTNTTDVFTNEPGRALINTSVGYDQNTGDIYVAYSIEDTLGTRTSANVYWATSTDGMTTWGAEQGPLTGSSDEYYKPSLTLNNFERMYVTWWGPAADDRVGDTVANIGPDTLLSATGTAVTSVRSATTDFHVGGAFVITSQSSRNVSSIRITETGTINGEDEVANIKLLYDLDTTAPYDCSSESFSGSELQFGVTDTNGFSGPNGGSTFGGTIINISPTQTACVYPVLDVLSSADSGDTIAIEITDPVNEVSVSGVDIFPDEAVQLTSSTSVVSPDLTQTHYHWRNDDGSEAAATSATGGSEDTALTALPRENEVRLRLGVSNEGSTTSLATTYRLEYGVAAPTCADVSTWIDVDETNDAWNMFDSPNLTDGSDTTNIAVSTGGVTDENTTFITPNGGVRDTQSTSSAITLDTTDFVELEYSVVASSSAIEGETYCFRVTDDGDSLSFYTAYPEATIDADVRVSATGTQISTAEIPTNSTYFGGAFVITENVGSRNVTDITITETGSIDAQTGLNNIQLFYDVDTTAPYDCSSELYSGGESQFGVTDTDGMSGENGTSTFSGSVGISTTATLCVYVVADITETAVNANTVAFEINSGTNDVLVSAGGSVAPSTPVVLTGSTTLSGGVLTQTHYHWRNDDGSESGATSATGGVEDTPITDFDLSSVTRLRFSVSNEGSTTSVATRFRLEYAPRIVTCSAAAVWTDVDEIGDAWDMFDSSNLTDGNNTTNIAEGVGGVTDENITFLTPNGGVRDTTSLTGSTTLETDEFIELEYAITSTASTLNDTTYCFRVSANGTDLQAYDAYAEVSTVPKRDYRVQQGNSVITGTSTVLVAGVDYTAPSASSAAFIRITNSHHTGAGDIVGGGAQNADDVTAYIVNPENITSSITLARTSSVNETFVDWEIVEFVGLPGTDNEMIVRDAGVINFTNGTVNATTSAISINDDSKIVVFVTGVRNQNTSRNYYAGQVTSDWSSSTDQAVFTRGATGNAFVDVSYAVVEFTGMNWNIQRAEHPYAAAGTIETESITAVSSLDQTFLHTQKRMGATTNVVHFGHEVWLSSIGAISFQLESGASVAVEQTSVAWVIENMQTGDNGMFVQRQNGTTVGGAEPLTLEVTFPTEVNALNNASIFVTSRVGGTNNAYPRPLIGARMTSTSTYELWRSDTGQTVTYRTEVVQWPVADLAIRQNYYRFYVDNDAVTPSDPWPVGVADLGENTSITVDDEPPGEATVVRIRQTLRVGNANMPAGFDEFKLQYAERAGTCTATTGWADVGATASSTIWRGFVGTSTSDGTSLSTDPPLPGDLVISVSDVAGTLEHENPAAQNPYVVFDGEDVEYDWYVQQNGAVSDTVYCFRAVRGNGDELDGYLHYPEIRTAGFSPATQNWRWFSDTENVTPNVPLANENVAPTNVDDEETVTLRVTVNERANVLGLNAKFFLQYSEFNDFSSAFPVVATSTCTTNSIWCYTQGGAVDNTLISSSTLSDGDGCVGGAGSGCGRHNVSPDFVTGHTHGALQAQEYSFTLVAAAPRVNAVYYFRLVEASTAEDVPFNTGEAFPSLVAGNSALTVSIDGLPSGTTTAGVVTDATTTATGIAFGDIPFNDDQIAAQRLTVSTNATEGYRVLKFATQDLTDSYGNPIASVSSTNAIPGGWSSVCLASSTGCFGYHTTDATLSGGSTRFAPSDTYAGIHTIPEEIIYSSIPAAESHDVVYRVQINELQPAGEYQTNIVYLAIPVY